MKKLNIALLAGGWSGEREISIKSGEAVYGALDKKKYDIKRYDPREDLVALIKERKGIDLAFVLMHGKFGEDGCIQGFLDLLGIPFVGSGVLPSAMALNKRVSKERFKGAGLKVVDDLVFHRGQSFSVDHIVATLGDSTVVKPVAEGSSLGVSICHSKEALLDGLDLAFQYDEEIIVERYIQGREITCCVMGNSVIETLPLVEIVPSSGYAFFDYEAKYTQGATEEICPAPLTEELNRMAQTCAIEAHKAIGCRVWSRTDMIIEDENIYVLEINTIPGMTETSLVPLSAGAAGLSLTQLLDKLIGLSLEVIDSE
jgi:D-alanine-D-alanine ligase